MSKKAIKVGDEVVVKYTVPPKQAVGLLGNINGVDGGGFGLGNVIGIKITYTDEEVSTLFGFSSKWVKRQHRLYAVRYKEYSSGGDKYTIVTEDEFVLVQENK